MRDKRLVERIIAGDRKSGELLVSEQYPRLFRLLRWLTDNREAAEDLTQQTFVRAWPGLPNFRGDCTLSTWLHQIAYREYVRWLKEKREHISLDSVKEMQSPEIDSTPDSLALAAALDKLPRDLRDTFLLHYLQELNVAEVARTLGVPEGTVKSRLYTARRRLRDLLQDSPSISQTPSAIISEVLTDELPAS